MVGRPPAGRSQSMDAPAVTPLVADRCASTAPRDGMADLMDDGGVTDSAAAPYVVGAFLALWWIVGENWLQRRTGQSWWTINQLVWGLFTAVLTVLVIHAGHPLVAVLPAAVTIWQLESARRSWVKRTPVDLLERNRLELEGRERPTRGASALGVRQTLFLVAVATIWTLLEHWGLSWATAGVVSAVIGVALFLPWRRGQVEATRPVVPADATDDRREGAPRGREFELTVTGRPAKLLGRLLDGSRRRPDGR